MQIKGFENRFLANVRSKFPALSDINERPTPVYLDNPAGTQVPEEVIEEVNRYYCRHNANYGGQFRTSRETVELTEHARTLMREFLGADNAGEVMFGSSMTAITFQVADMIGDLLEPGDEILLTEMDHDGNVTPWLHMAERRGLTVKWLPINTETARYDLDSLEEIVNERTKFAAINYASNITGTINDVAGIVELLQKFGTLTYIDAVQYAPHGVIDVKALNCDFLVCSAYKFYGPHLGVLWAHSRILERLKPIRLQAAPAHWPQAFERGCLNSEGIAGLRGALNYYKALAKLDGYIGDSPFKHTKILMHQHEALLTEKLIDGLSLIEGVRILGITDTVNFDDRVSTVSVHIPRHDPKQLARYLGDREIYVWDGHNYALTVIEAYGLSNEGGVLRFGPVHYNTSEEIDLTVATLADAIHSGIALRK